MALVGVTCQVLTYAAKPAATVLMYFNVIQY